MTDGSEEVPPTNRESPVGTPVVRGDERVAGERAKEAVAFDPDDPESIQEAVEAVTAFTRGELRDDRFDVLRGAAACAALVRSFGSYTTAAEHAGENVTVSVLRKWARVHDLPRPVRRHVAIGDIPPTAAKHIARVGGEARYQLAFAVIDNGLTVREVRAIASEVNEGRGVEDALRDRGVTPGEVTVVLPLDTYRELRRDSALKETTPGDMVANALNSYLR